MCYFRISFGCCGRFTPAEIVSFCLSFFIVCIWVLTGHWLLMDGKTKSHLILRLNNKKPIHRYRASSQSTVPNPLLAPREANLRFKQGNTNNMQTGIHCQMPYHPAMRSITSYWRPVCCCEMRLNFVYFAQSLAYIC